MKKFSCIAIDDEPLALLVITQFCERFGNLDLSTFSEPRIGLEEIKRHKPDLVFLDIEMNSINGLDIAHSLGLSQGTVRNHVSSSMLKMNARTRAEAASLARAAGWL